MAYLSAIAPIVSRLQDGIDLHEDNKTYVVRPSMLHIVQTRQAYQSNCANNGKDNGDNAERFLEPGGILVQTTTVAQPALGDEDEVKRHHRDCAEGDEEGLQVRCANV